MKISICSWCGQPFDIEEGEIEIDVCPDCEFLGNDSIGELDDDDLKFIRGDD